MTKKHMARISRALKILVLLLGETKGRNAATIAALIGAEGPAAVASYLTRLTAAGLLRRSGRPGKYGYRLTKSGRSHALDAKSDAKRLGGV